MEAETVTFKELGQIAYETCFTGIEKAYPVLHTDEWEELPPAMKAVWRGVALEVLRVDRERRHGMVD